MILLLIGAAMLCAGLYGIHRVSLEAATANRLRRALLIRVLAAAISTSLGGVAVVASVALQVVL